MIATFFSVFFMFFSFHTPFILIHADHALCLHVNYLNTYDE